MKISGGYYIKARKFQESSIAHAPPHVREIWDWILMQANHKDTGVCKRGQCYRTYKDIQEGLSWFIGYRKMAYKKYQCETAMKWLKKATMVTTTKTTRGMLITVLNYDRYQTPENYENHTKADTRTTMKPQPTDTINKKEKKERKKETKRANGYSESFLEFYGHYPLKENKKAAFKAWAKIEGRKELLPTMIKAIRDQAAEKIRKKKNNEFCPEWAHPSTWLNNARWEDQVSTPIESQESDENPHSWEYQIS